MLKFVLMISGHAIGWAFFGIFILICLITAVSARSQPETIEESTNESFNTWFKECHHQAYLMGYPEEAITKMSADIFMDLWDKDMEPKKAVTKYFNGKK